MAIIRLIKYPGSKNALVPIIRNIFLASKEDIFVDVFGGSGLVSLNIGRQRIVYNDLNRDLYNLFVTIKLFPDELFQIARERTVTRTIFDRYGETLASDLVKNVNDLGRAFMTFYRFNTGFGGMGSTYRTKREKSSYTLTRRILTHYKTIKSRVSNWRIENRDFRDLVGSLDRKNVFFYFDPPYTGKNWYDVNFSGKDMKNLKEITEALKGKFLCTLDQADVISASIFGDPNRTVQFINENKKKVFPAAYRKFSLYTNVELDPEGL